MNKPLKVLLVAAMICAVAVSAFSFVQYRKAREEYSALKSDLAASKAVWNEINEKKLDVLRDLNAARNELREADLVIEESAGKAEELKKEIETLEKEIEALTSAVP